ncbi:hypothetical protein OEZ86_003553 [Tetradesmus obliquus]|nr:hypothetical protein OEZ86_003553 [Tetradesmus obliquus]
MTLQQLSQCYCRCVEDVALALHLLGQPDRPGGRTAVTLLRVQTNIARFCWLLSSLLLLNRHELLATFASINCETMQPWLEPAPQQQQRQEWLMQQLQLTQQQQETIALGAGLFGSYVLPSIGSVTPCTG